APAPMSDPASLVHTLHSPPHKHWMYRFDTHDWPTSCCNRIHTCPITLHCPARRHRSTLGRPRSSAVFPFPALPGCYSDSAILGRRMDNQTDTLFDDPDNEVGRPLAVRMRPRGLEEFVGQAHLLGEGSALRTAIEQGKPHS